MDFDPEQSAKQRVGSIIAGKWRLERVLGVGGMASVFFARDTVGRSAALKLLHPELNGYDEVRKRFLREGPIGNALGGVAELPGIAKIFESGEAEDGTAYLAMEVLEGETLFERLDRTFMVSVPEALALVEQVLDVLVVAHGCGIVHRDLKPENIHMDRNGRVKLLDFGIARVMDALRSIQGLPEKTATRMGVIMGTAAYMAPEQAMGLIDQIDSRTDLYAVGATMFRMLSGRLVHESTSEAQEVIAAATQRAPPLANVAPAIPREVCAVVDRALAFDKTERYPDAETMRAEVRAIRRGLPPPYAQSVIEGRIAAGAPMPTIAEAALPAVAPAPRAPIAKAIAPTIVEDASRLPQLGAQRARPAPTLRDVIPSSPVAMIAVIGASALTLGIVIGIVLVTCGVGR